MDSSETAGAVRHPVTLGPNLALFGAARKKYRHLLNEPNSTSQSGPAPKQLFQQPLFRGWLLSPTNPEPKEAKPFAGSTLQDDFASF